MQRILFLLTCLILSRTLGAGVITLNIYLNTNQCVNCNIALIALRNISAPVIKNTFLSKANSAVAEDIMEPYRDVKNLNFRYFDKAANPFKTALINSFCILYNGKTKIDSFGLNALFEKTKVINALANETGLNKTFGIKHKIVIPDSVKLSERLTFFTTQNRLSICDYLTNKNVTFTFKNNNTEIDKILQIKGSAFKPYPFLKSGIFDTALYRQRYGDIKYVGKTKPQINSSYLTDSALYLFLTFPCIIAMPTDTGIGGAYFMYKKNLYTYKSELYGIPEDQLPASLNKEYFINNISAFYPVNNKFYFTLYQEVLDKENYFLTEYALQSDFIKYKSLLPHKISDSTYLNTDFGNTQVFLSKSNANFYFAEYQPVILNTINNTLYDFSKVLGDNYKHNFLFHDAILLPGGNIGLLVKHKSIEKYMIYNPQSNSLVSQSEIKFNATFNPESIKFLNKDNVMVLDQSNKNILLYGFK